MTYLLTSSDVKLIVTNEAIELRQNVFDEISRVTDKHFNINLWFHGQLTLNYHIATQPYDTFCGVVRFQ